MIARLRFQVDGKPRPQPRTRSDGRRGRHYTPDTGIEGWKQRVLLGFRAQGTAARAACNAWTAAKLPIDIRILVLRSKPKSSRLDWPTSKPDWDNFAKGIQDALETAGAFKNDSQCCLAVVAKDWCLEGEEEGATIVLQPVKDRASVRALFA